MSCVLCVDLQWIDVPYLYETRVLKKEKKVPDRCCKFAVGGDGG